MTQWLNYLYLQKFIVGDTDTKLVSEIDNLLERVFNIFSSGMELGAELELFAAKPTGGSTELVLLQVKPILVKKALTHSKMSHSF